MIAAGSNGLEIGSEGNWPPRAAQEQRLRQLELALVENPDAIELSIERAALLGALYRRVEAQQAFIDILSRAPTHFNALNEFGALLSSMGAIAAACRVYTEAIAHHPDNPVPHVNLANLLLRGNELLEARAHYEAALRLDPDHPQAHQGLGAVLAAVGDRESAKSHFQIGFRSHAISTQPYRGVSSPIPLLLLVSSGDGNVPTASFLDDRVFLTSVIVTDYLDPAVPLPPHRLIFNAVGDADVCAPALEAAVGLMRRSRAPVINHPAAVLRTGRADNAARLRGLAHVVTPRIHVVPRRVLAGPDATEALARLGSSYPLLLRSPGFHTGRNFIRIDTAADLSAAVAELPGDELLMIEYLDARRVDGNARKYRVMIVDGRIYPLHLAISRQWKVHYFTADMDDNAEHRSEDAAFLENMPAVLGDKAMSALERIRDALGLDYGGIDFGLNAAGDVLLFEANATMVVSLPDADQRWAYRRPAIERILDAVRGMIADRAADVGRRKAG